MWTCLFVALALSGCGSQETEVERALEEFRAETRSQFSDPAVRDYVLEICDHFEINAGGSNDDRLTVIADSLSVMYAGEYRLAQLDAFFAEAAQIYLDELEQRCP